MLRLSLLQHVSTLSVLMLAAGLLVVSTEASAACRIRNCSNPSDCIAATNEQQACRRAEQRLQEIENERKRAEYNKKHQKEIEAVKKIDEANKKVRTMGTPAAIDPPNR